MDFYLFTRIIHIISSTIVFGTGIGIAFFMFRSRFSVNLHEKYYASHNTVLADNLFTVPAVIVQPLSGFALIYMADYNWDEPWLLLTYILYVIAGLCWLPVVWIQIQLRGIVATCIENNSELPERYHRLFRLWFILGWPAFIALIIVFYLMVAKPV